MKVRGSVEKHVFREAMRPYLPESIYTRKKHYFRAPPTTANRNGRLHDLVRDVVAGPDLDALPFFDPAKVRRFVASLDGMSDRRRAALDPALMEIVSLCLLQRSYAMSTCAREDLRLAL
jgi:asparagine synthase (glutamine-hydrolysing)